MRLINFLRVEMPKKMLKRTFQTNYPLKILYRRDNQYL
jgi:hypothetical protein